MIELLNIDCMEYMATLPNKAFDLAIVDPPYGIGFSDYERGSMGIKVKERHTKNGKKQWDNNGVPTDKYFTELKRVSVNQIVWGGNYFPVLWGGLVKVLFFGISKTLSIILLTVSLRGPHLINCQNVLITGIMDP